MTPQQSSGPQSTADGNEAYSMVWEGEKKMKSTVPGRRSTPSAITKALSKSRSHSRDAVMAPSGNNSNSLIQAFTSQSTVFIMDEHVHLTTGLQTQERHLFLFSDSLIIAKAKSSSSLKLKQQLRLCEVWLASCVHKVSERKLSAKNCFVIGWPTTNHVVTLSSPEAKEKWFSALQWHIKKLKQEEYPSRIALKIVLLGSGSTTPTTTVSVNNSDTAEDVIKASIQQLGISGRQIDYCLWVISGKTEAPYPLIGHEHPFSIAMNHLRDSTERPHWTEHHDDGTLLLDQLPKEHQVQFYLKLRPAVHGHMQADSSRKHIRRKRSLIDWALRRGNASRSSSQSDSPTTPRKLFGHSLSSICHNGNLPKPIMDMLQLLYRQGPTTRGIFRRSANAKTCKELKERLNSGDAVRVEEESVFVAASVVTDFLRNLPGSVLSTDLYEKWMEVMEIDDHDEKIETIKRLLDQLPGANLTLLRHLFSLLYHIQESSEENHMTAYNLALCIAPNMLWLPTPAGPEEESKSTGKVASLIQLLIEQALSVFGDDIDSLFTDLNSRQGALEDAIDDLYQQSIYSSDEFDSEQERLFGLHAPERDPGFFPLNDFVLKEGEEPWSPIKALDPFKWLHLTEDGGVSHWNLDGVSCRSDGSVLSLAEERGVRASRGRCSSEPSVCLGSQPPLCQPHNPIARQSSCDAAMIHSNVGRPQPTRRPRPEGSGEPRDEGDASPLVGGGRHRSTFWRSPQVPSRLKHQHPYKLTQSGRSSYSSLSSTATSPSASSLSSLDSTFSYCSDSVFSPSDGPSLAFAFGTSARLRSRSPDTPARFPKDWSSALPGSVLREQGSSEWYNEYDEENEDDHVCAVESQAVVDKQGEKEDPPGASEALQTDMIDERERSSGISEPRMEPSLPEVRQREVCQSNGLEDTSDNSEKGPRMQGQSTSFKQIQLTRPKQTSDKIKRTKITFYVAPNNVAGKRTAALATEENSVVASLPNAGSAEPASADVQVHIPQTVFYGQNTPLVLQSVVMRPPAKAKEQSKPGKTADHAVGNSSPATAVSKAHTKASNTIRHTIRIRLPAAVRSTVKEYFSHSDNRNYQSDAKAADKELQRSKLEWQSKRAATGTPKENVAKLPSGEGSFI